jgi:hypothetical protein
LFAAPQLDSDIPVAVVSQRHFHVHDAPARVLEDKVGSIVVFEV